MRWIPVTGELSYKVPTDIINTKGNDFASSSRTWIWTSIIRLSLFIIKGVHCATLMEDLVSIIIYNYLQTNMYIDVYFCQKSIDSQIHKICKYLRFILDNLGKERPKLTFFVWRYLQWKLDIVWMLLWKYQM